jgi:hypothetical protein
MLVGAGVMTSCTDKMDNLGTDSSYDRTFAITSLDITPDATTALVEYKGAGASSFQIQYSTDLDALRSSEEPGAQNTTMVETTSKTSFTLTNLITETDYYLRIRAIASGKKPSRWMYYRKDETKN